MACKKVFIASALILTPHSVCISQPLYGLHSPWRTPVETASAKPIRTELLRGLEAKRVRGITVNVDSWTPSVIYAKKADSRHDLAWTKWILRNVPLSNEIYRSASYFSTVGDTDASICLIDELAGITYSLYGVRSRKGPPGISINAGGALSRNGSGWWDNRSEPWNGRASGGALCGGLILASELRSQNLRHAIAIGWPRSLILKSSPAYPATTSDGTCEQPDRCIPMGARIQLDPSLKVSDLKKFGLNKTDILIAKALQKYGAYVVDSSHTVSIYVESGLGKGKLNYGLSGEWSQGIMKHLMIAPPPPEVRLESRKTMNIHVQTRNSL